MTKNILVMDGGNEIRLLFKSNLKRTGCTVETAVTGENGIIKMACEKLCNIFIDLHLPKSEMNGVDAGSNLYNSYHGVPAHILTASYYLKGEMQEVIKAGRESNLYQKSLDWRQIKKSVKCKGVCELLKGGKLFFFKLFITGQTTSSERTIEIIRTIFDKHLKHDYELKVIDALENPGLVKMDNIIATPTLVVEGPCQHNMTTDNIPDNDISLPGMHLNMDAIST